MLYRTYFTLTNPVRDYQDAYDYLTADDMTKYLKSNPKCSKETSNKILSITWILKNDFSGRIELETSEELSMEELDMISDWVKGQNSDGLGEGFEQQDFACYIVTEYGDIIDPRCAWDYEGESEEIMSSFDWETNDYKFELVSKD